MTKILVIDDDRDVKESTQIMLTDEGYEVSIACDGKQGLIEFERNKPDITFLDIKMPEMDGYDTFAEIRKKDPQAKIAFVTGFAIDDKRYYQIKHQAVSTIHKPIKIGKMLTVIQTNVS